jgi:NAD(P) transhydrogenase
MMRARNVTFRFGEAVESIEVADGPPRKAVLHLESGKRIVTDMVLYSAGRIAATDALNLLNAGIAADERGRVTVDDCFRTTVPNISVFNYPTLAECYKVAALDASNKLRY